MAVQWQHSITTCSRTSQPATHPDTNMVVPTNSCRQPRKRRYHEWASFSCSDPGVGLVAPSAFRRHHAVALGVGQGRDTSSLVIVDALPCNSLGVYGGNIGDDNACSHALMKLHPAVEELLMNLSELLSVAQRQQGDRAYDAACTNDKNNRNTKVVTIQCFRPEHIRVGRFSAKHLTERNLPADQTLCVDLRLVHSDSQLFEEAIIHDCYNNDDANMCVSGLPTSYMKIIEQLAGVGVHRHRALLCVHHSLSGRLVARGSYVVIALSPIWSSDATGSCSWDYLSLDPTSSLEAGADEVAIFQVDSVQVIGGDKLHEDIPASPIRRSADQPLDADVRASDDDNGKSCYRLTDSEDSPKFSLRVFSDVEKARWNTKTEEEESLKLPTNDSTCPGYEGLLDELLRLAKIQHPSAAPSGVMLTGCTGVGKSRMASCLADRLLQQGSDGTVPRPIVRRVSAKDVLLAAASYVDVKILIDYVLGPAKTESVARRVLVIDDLDSVIDPSGEESSASLNPEKLLAFNAIVGAVDTLLKGVEDYASQGLASKSPRHVSVPFVLGLCCASSEQFPPDLVSVGRFEKVLTMAAPTQYQRERIFQSMFEDLPLLQEEYGIQKLARMWAMALASQTAGFVASDIRRVCADALTRSQSRHLCAHSNNKSTTPPSFDKYSLSDARITWEDMRESARVCVPSQLARLDVTSTSTYTEQVEGIEVGVSDYKIAHEQAWSIFGGYQDMKKRAYRNVVSPWIHETFRQEEEALTTNTPDRRSILQPKVKSDLALGIPPPSGVLFHGPSGVGKTLAAQCLASSLSLPVVKVVAADILDQWLGGSEAAIRSLFARARSASPCVLLFDDIDAIASNRDDDDGDSTNLQSRILSTLLNEMDGVSSQANRGGVLVIASTNRLGAIDSALLRPGRLEEHFELGLPSALDIEEILGLHLAKVRVHDDVTIYDLARRLVSVAASGADVEGLCTGACLHAIRRATNNDIEDTDKIALSANDFDLAFKAINAQGGG